jgi:hypothetical protein
MSCRARRQLPVVGKSVAAVLLLRVLVLLLLLFLFRVVIVAATRGTRLRWTRRGAAAGR